VGGCHAVSSKSDGTPLGREEGTPQEVANAALFLGSDESSFITGDRMICAGGRYM
jgi:NAD(P)-dependent dehydrogenase (short-subunit alcohol dehydrogenase family)